MVDRHYRAVLDNVPDGVLIESSDRIAFVNSAYAHLLGYSSAVQLAYATIRDIAHPEDLERLMWFGNCRRDGKPAPTRYTFRARASDARIVTFDASISHTRVDGDVLITTVVRALARDQEKKEACPISLPGMQRLSPREREVIEHLLAGRRSKEIAAMFDVSEKTIGTHRSRAFQKLALRSDLDLFRLAAERGLI